VPTRFGRLITDTTVHCQKLRVEELTPGLILAQSSAFVGE
jgi:hypothetical protein